jgi:4a-hydroxytetrahydrobiopterin dehydratase
MKPLTQTELEKFLSGQPLWCLADGKIVRDWRFKDFVAAMEFVNRVAEIAEAAGHHPDIDIRYNRVRLGLVTHDTGGITESDAAMAAQLTAHFAS